MKKLLIFMLVLAMASLANATVIDVIVKGVGDSGHAGTSGDRLVVGETIEIQIVLNYNQYAGYASYDGYITDAMGVDLHVSGSGTLSVPGIEIKAGRIGDDLKYHTSFGAWSQSGTNDGTVEGYTPLIVSNQIAKMSGGVLTGFIAGDENGNPPSSPTSLVWNLFITCTGESNVALDLTLQDSASRYAAYTNGAGTAPYAPGWVSLLESDLGDLTIYQVPEPATIVLLGLGGLFLSRRRR